MALGECGGYPLKVWAAAFHVWWFLLAIFYLEWLINGLCSRERRQQKSAGFVGQNLCQGYYLEWFASVNLGGDNFNEVLLMTIFFHCSPLLPM